MRKMKNCSFDWIGQIPEDWMMTKVKFVADFYNGDRGKNYPSGDDLVDDGIVFLTSNNIHSTVLDTNPEITKYITPERYKLLGGAKIKKGDLVFCLRGSIGLCSINESEDEGTVASSLTVLRPKNINNHFLNFILNSKIAEIQTKKFENGSCAANLSAENVGTYIIPYPPLVEQQRIADFLDEKCGEIDSIRSDVQREIEILNDYKKSVISETVTKGLNPKAKLKDSGIEWIGKIPEGWKTSYIKRLFDITLGKMINSEKDAGLENYLCAANIKWTGINVGVHKQMHFSEYEKKLYLLNDGDILVMEGGMAGTAAIYHNEFYPCYIQNSVMRCRSKNATNLQTFLYYWLFAIYHLGYIDRICNRATIQHYTKEKLGNTPILFPPLPEQKAIADYLDEKCSEIDATIADKQRQLETLDEYKKSLIFEYVTGKKEVS